VAIVRIGLQQGDSNELASKYLQVQEKLRSDGQPFPPLGLKVHVAAKTDEGLRVANVWESEQQADAAWPRIQEAMRSAGASTPRTSGSRSTRSSTS
jgi:hypothetical protein